VSCNLLAFSSILDDRQRGDDWNGWRQKIRHESIQNQRFAGKETKRWDVYIYSTYSNHPNRNLRVELIAFPRKQSQGKDK
jgi:transcription elongation factor GreA-like protein